MDLQKCWVGYLEAEQFLEQGHWSEAQRLYEQVLIHLPSHIYNALNNDTLKPCQFGCLIRGFTDAATSQSEILNKLGQYQKVFDLLNQSYALLQFISVESTQIVQDTKLILDDSCNKLLSHIDAFCNTQKNAQWIIEFKHILKAHHHFSVLKDHGGVFARFH